MRICPKCLSVYASSDDLYCRSDGEMTLDTIDKRADEPIEKLKMKLETEHGWMRLK